MSAPSEEMLLSREALEAILDSLAEGIVTLDWSGRVLSVNRAACEILEVEKDEALHHTCRSLFGEKFCAAAHEVRNAVQAGQPVENILSKFQTRSGDDRILTFRTNPLQTGPDGPAGNVVVFRDTTELLRLKADLTRQYQLHNLVGKSKPMQEIFRLIEEVADSDATVLIEGESGTGKELVARAIHHLSPRTNGPFVAVDCSSLAEGVLESELFGHVKGAFTGAMRDKQGRFEAASRGTIFLDEIGDLAPAIQVKLLRVLQERVIQRVGGDQTIPVDIRVIAATHRPLAEMVGSGDFRQDLYYRLRVVPIRLPALRERRDDLPLLAQHFVDLFAEQTGRAIEGAGQEAMALILDYPWPGNVRELENAIEYAFVKARSGQIGPEHLPPEIRDQAGLLGPAFHRTDQALSVADVTSPEQLRGLLEANRWNVAKTARQLGVSRTTLYKRIHTLRLGRPG
ncbi:MAG: sigma 54-interacting transcriptional regulator [Pirellulales bacterium]|nr:sigma 54-interacting transcriptional regulator [Pirellulales bacterium]